VWRHFWVVVDVLKLDFFGFGFWFLSIDVAAINNDALMTRMEDYGCLT
jgi:hypothetical protein